MPTTKTTAKRKSRPSKLLQGLRQAAAHARGEADPRRVRVTVIKPVNVRAIRAKLGLSQPAFARRYGISLNTLRGWEQGKTFPDGPALSYLRVIEKHPKAVADALAG